MVAAVFEKPASKENGCKFSRALNSYALNVDHDHVTGKTRSLLCLNHNAGLGLFGDDPALMREAAAYIEMYRKEFGQTG